VEDREGGRKVVASETRGEKEAGEQAEERAPRPSRTEKTNDHTYCIAKRQYNNYIIKTHGWYISKYYGDVSGNPIGDYISLLPFMYISDPTALITSLKATQKDT